MSIVQIEHWDSETEKKKNNQLLLPYFGPLYTLLPLPLHIHTSYYSNYPLFWENGTLKEGNTQ